MLTTQEAQFVQAMLDWRNPHRAGKQLGLTREQAVNLSLREDVQEALKRHYEAALMSLPEALACLSEIARGDWGPYLTVDEETGDVTFDFPAMVADRKGYLVAKLSQGPRGPAVSFPDRLPALRLILEVHGALQQGTSPEEIEALVRRYDRGSANGHGFSGPR